MNWGPMLKTRQPVVKIIGKIKTKIQKWKDLKYENNNDNDDTNLLSVMQNIKSLIIIIMMIIMTLTC